MRRLVGVGVGVGLCVGAVVAVSAAPNSVVSCVAKAVPSAWGPVRVECIPNLVVDSQPVFGAFLPWERRILLEAKVPPPFQRAVLAHEECHVALMDADIHPPPEVAEKICDAMAVQRTGRTE